MRTLATVDTPIIGVVRAVQVVVFVAVAACGAPRAAPSANVVVTPPLASDAGIVSNPGATPGIDVIEAPPHDPTVARGDVGRWREGGAPPKSTKKPLVVRDEPAPGRTDSGLVTWSAVAARDIVKTAARCAELGMTTETRLVSPEQLVAGELCDAVIIATPDGLHREHAIMALANGLNVLVERPLALTLSDANDLVAMARDKDRVLQVGYHHRHHAGHELVHRDLAPLVGNLCTIFIRWARPDLLVSDDGSRPHADGSRWWSLAALGTDCIDLSLGFAAGAVTDAVCVRNPQRGIDRAAEVSLRFAGGPLAHISVSVGHRARSIVLLTGTDGEIECLNTLGGHGAGTIVHRTADSLRGVLLRPNAPERSLPFVAEDPYLRQLRAFVARCGEGRMKIDAHAITNLEVLDRITPP